MYENDIRTANINRSANIIGLFKITVLNIFYYRGLIILIYF